METEIKKQTSDNAKTPEFDPETMFITQAGEIKKLSKFGIWLRDNPGGLFYVKDRRAINRMRY